MEQFTEMVLSRLVCKIECTGPEFKLNDSPGSIDEFGFSSPFYDVQYDFKLKALIKIQ